MPNKFTRWFSSLIVSAAVLSAAAQTNWPQFRGEQSLGVASNRNLPTTWSTNQNVKWKTPIQGKAWSSPVVWGKQIWFTTATPDAKQLFVVCVDADSGKILREDKLFEVERPQFHHAANYPLHPRPSLRTGACM